MPEVWKNFAPRINPAAVDQVCIRLAADPARRYENTWPLGPWLTKYTAVCASGSMPIPETSMPSSRHRRELRTEFVLSQPCDIADASTLTSGSHRAVHGVAAEALQPLAVFARQLTEFVHRLAEGHQVELRYSLAFSLLQPTRESCVRVG